MTLAELRVLVAFSDEGPQVDPVWTLVPVCAARLGVTIEEVWAMEAGQALGDMSVCLPSLLSKEMGEQFAALLPVIEKQFSPERLQEMIG